MLTHMVFFVVKLLNLFPAKGGVSTEYSPKTIMSGQTINYKQYSLPFGTYCQVHEEDGQRDSLAARTQGAISVGPSTNRQGGQLFFSLNTGRIITRRAWTIIPMPQPVITRVNELAADQPSLLTFTDRHGNEIGDADFISQPDVSHEIPGVVADAVEIPGVDAALETKTTEYDHNDMLTTPAENQRLLSLRMNKLQLSSQLAMIMTFRATMPTIQLQLSLNQRHIYQQPPTEKWRRRQ